MQALTSLDKYTPVKLVEDTIYPIDSKTDNIYGITTKAIEPGEYKNAVITSGILYHYNGTPGSVVYAKPSSLTTTLSFDIVNQKIGYVLASGNLQIDLRSQAYIPTPVYLRQYVDSPDPIGVINAIPNSITLMVDQVEWFIEDDFDEDYTNGFVTSIIPKHHVIGVVFVKYTSAVP